MTGMFRLERPILPEAPSACVDLFRRRRDQPSHCSALLTLSGALRLLTKLIHIILFFSIICSSACTLHMDGRMIESFQNGAECSLSAAGGSPTCICPTRFSGVFCELAPSVGLADYQQVGKVTYWVQNLSKVDKNAQKRPSTTGLPMLGRPLQTRFLPGHLHNHIPVPVPTGIFRQEVK